MPRPSPITSEQKLELVRRYQEGESRNSLALEFGASRPFVTDLLRASGVHVRGIAEACLADLRHDAFDNAESNDTAAYWVGFLMADGCISHQRHSPHVIVALSWSDREHLESLRAFLGSSNGIYYVPGNEREQRSECARLDVASSRLVEALAGYGVVARKSKTAEAKRLQGNRSFWRGVVDGDGWVGIARHRRYLQPRIGLVGAPALVGQFLAFAKTRTDTAAGLNADRTVKQCCLSGRHAVRLIHALYADCQIALPRKLASAKSILAQYQFLLDQAIGYHWRQPSSAMG